MQMLLFNSNNPDLLSVFFKGIKKNHLPTAYHLQNFDLDLVFYLFFSICYTIYKDFQLYQLCDLL